MGEAWRNTTHDWARTVDLQHLATIKGDLCAYAPGGVRHLVHEVLAYAAEEAESLCRPGTVQVMLHTDGSVSVADDGRGTDTRRDAAGLVVKKPVLATRDLRFFDDPDAALLPDGRPRRLSRRPRDLVKATRRLGRAGACRVDRRYVVCPGV